jgi:hypothetical protein
VSELVSVLDYKTIDPIKLGKPICGGGWWRSI